MISKQGLQNTSNIEGIAGGWCLGKLCNHINLGYLINKIEGIKLGKTLILQLAIIILFAGCGRDLY